MKAGLSVRCDERESRNLIFLVKYSLFEEVFEHTRVFGVQMYITQSVDTLHVDCFMTRL